MTADQLSPGEVYFTVCFEDEELTRMVIQSYEFLRKEDNSRLYPGEAAYCFRPIDPFAGDNQPTPYDGEFEFTERQLESLRDLAGLIDELQRIQRNGPGRAWATDD